MKRIPLTQGQVALVDNEDFERINAHKWRAMWDQNTRSYYAARTERGADGKRHTVRMHREIIRAKKGQYVDHENHDGCDNRRDNLRVCTNQKNGANRRMQNNNTSGFKGVSWHKRDKKWCASVGGRRNRIHIGQFSTAIEAARAYDTKAIRLNGEFALTNKMLGLLP